jgi:glutathione synthase/RimK-type ligase-like ATP-grasp enzyme
MEILLWGLMRDAPMAAVYSQLSRLGAPARFLDQRQVLRSWLDVRIGDRPRALAGVGDDEIDLDGVGAVYLRPHDSGRLPAVAAHPAGSPYRTHAAALDAALLGWANRTPAYVVNRPEPSAGNGSKPYQLRAVAAAGFAVPPTLVTTDPVEAAEFLRGHGTVIAKSVSGIRSRVRRLGPADAARLADVATCPTQFQRYVAGTDVRVHVVGASVFATEVRSDADDYRYARAQGHPEAELVATELPEPVTERCRRLAARLSLPVAGIDLRRGADGDWYCFEVNPSPAFSYYEAGTGQPIAAAVAGLLVSAALCARRDRGRTVHKGPCVGCLPPLRRKERVA